MGFVYLGMSDEERAEEADLFRTGLAEFLEIDPARLDVEINVAEDGEGMRISYEIQVDGDLPNEEMFEKIGIFCNHGIHLSTPYEA
jgi:hypothetical protein